MHEEVNREVITLAIRGGKISADILKKAVLKALKTMEAQQKKISDKSKQIAQENKPGKKTSLRKLMNSGAQITNIEVTEKNIQSFEKVARKYDIDYGLKKDKTKTPPIYYVFFKAKDVDVMKAAFQEYVGKTTLQKAQSNESIRKRLTVARDLVMKHRQLEKQRGKEQQPSL